MTRPRTAQIPPPSVALTRRPYHPIHIGKEPTMTDNRNDREDRNDRDDLIHTPSDPFYTPSPEAEARRAAYAAALTRAYRIRGCTMPPVGALTCLLFAVLVPFWYGVWFGHATPIYLLFMGAVPMGLAIPCHVLGGNRGFLTPHPTSVPPCTSWASCSTPWAPPSA